MWQLQGASLCTGTACGRPPNDNNKRVKSKIRRRRRERRRRRGGINHSSSSSSRGCYFRVRLKKNVDVYVHLIDDGIIND
jgi:hypothetical protein